MASLTDATLIDPDRKEADRSISLADAIREVIEANLDLKAAEASVAAGREDVTEARSTLLPQIDVSVTGALIDDDLGSPVQAERQLSGDLSVTQLIYSERALANVSIQN